MLGGIAATGAVAEVVDKGDWVVAGDETVGDDGVTCNSITFNASAKLSGGPITLGSDGITVASGVKGAVIESVIAGSANFTVQGSGMDNSEISFKGENTFTGNMTVRGVLLHAYTDQAFGSTSGSTTLYACTTVNNANLLGQIKFHGIDTSEPILHYNKPEKGTAYYFDANTTNILRGKVTGKDGRMNFGAGANAYTVISNDWSGVNFPDELKFGSTVVFDVYGQMSYSRFYFYGKWIMHHRVGSYGNDSYGTGIYGDLVMAATNVFAASDTATAAYGARMHGTGTWDLNGYDQRLDRFYKFKADGSSSGRYVTFTVKSAKPANFFYDNTACDQEFDGKFTGKVRVVVEGTKTLTLNGASTTEGELVVTNVTGSGTATLALGGTASWAGTNVTVASGARLQINSAANFSDYAKIRVAKGGQLVMNASLAIRGLWTNGVAVAEGSYGSSQSSAQIKDDDHFSGSGVLTVTSEPVVETIWVGGGADDLLTTDENWQNGKAPNLENGLALTTFAASGTRAVVPSGTARLGQVTLTLPDETPRFAFEPQGEASKVALASVTFGEASSVREYTNNVSTVLENGQLWNLPSADTAFYQNAPISSALSIDWSKDGSGTLYLMKPADGLTGTFHLLAGNLHLKNPAALGEAKLEITYGSKIYFYGGVISNDIQIIGSDVSRNLYYQANTTTEFKGLFDYNSHYDRAAYSSGSKVIFSGGVKDCSGWRSGDGHLVFTNKSCNIAAFDGGHTKVEIWTTNNTFGVYYNHTKSSYESFIFNYGTPVELHAPYAANTNTATANGVHLLAPFITAKAGDSYSIFGNDQQFAHVEEGTIVDASSWTITSDKPAQMKVYQDQDKTLSHLLVTGAAGLTLNGPNALTLTGRTCTTTGALEVEDGTLTLGAGESFPNVRTVRVSGGTLALTSAGQLDRRVNLYVSGSGKISIPDGVTLEVRRLYVNGVSQKMGDYTEGVVTGGGKVHVPGGAAIILR